MPTHCFRIQILWVCGISHKPRGWIFAAKTADSILYAQRLTFTGYKLHAFSGLKLFCAPRSIGRRRTAPPKNKTTPLEHGFYTRPDSVSPKFHAERSTGPDAARAYIFTQYWILLKVVQLTVLQAPYAPRLHNMINRHYISYKNDDVRDTE